MDMKKINNASHDELLLYNLELDLDQAVANLKRQMSRHRAIVLDCDIQLARMSQSIDDHQEKVDKIKESIKEKKLEMGGVE